MVLVDGPAGPATVNLSISRPETEAKVLQEEETPSRLRRFKIPSSFRDYALALAITSAAQCLIAGLEYGLDKLDCPFPPAILAMIGVFGLFSALGGVWRGLETFYQRHLRRAVSDTRRPGSPMLTTWLTGSPGRFIKSPHVDWLHDPLPNDLQESSG